MARCPERRRGVAPWLVVAVLGCASGCDAPAADEPTPAPPDDGDLAAVQAWLVAGSYLEWERHDPEPGPGMVGGARVYLSPELADSLRAGASFHPAGAAAVREIVDAEDPERMVGFAFTHKLADAEDGADSGDAWFFYEVFSLEADAAPLVAERGAPGCVGCHQDGVDFVRSQLVLMEGFTAPPPVGQSPPFP